jgi:hypothetical protein
LDVMYLRPGTSGIHRGDESRSCQIAPLA